MRVSTVLAVLSAAVLVAAAPVAAGGNSNNGNGGNSGNSGNGGGSSNGGASASNPSYTSCPTTSSGTSTYVSTGMYPGNSVFSAANAQNSDGYLSVGSCAPTCLRMDPGSSCTKYLDAGDSPNAVKCTTQKDSKATCCADKSNVQYGSCQTSSNCNGMYFMACNGGNCPNFDLPENGPRYTCEVDNPDCGSQGKCWGKVKCWAGTTPNVAGACGSGHFGDIRNNMVCIADGNGNNNAVAQSKMTKQYYITGNMKICGSCAPSFTHGDPQFSGFLGQSYQVHGQSNAIYNIISTPTMQYNALFTYRSEGECRQGTECFSHPGNYFGETGLVVRSENGTETNRLHVVSGPVDVGLQATLDGVKMVPGDAPRALAGCVQVQLVNAYTVRVESCSDFSLTIENSDMFLNQDVSVSGQMLGRIASVRQAARAHNTSQVDEMRESMPHGILGQTWEMREYPNRWKYIQGHLFDYIIESDIFGTDFKYNRF